MRGGMVWGRRVATAVAAFAAVAALVGVMAPAASAAIHVHCPGQDLQNKIGSATPGSTLLITGTCHGNFQVAQDLTLQGDPSATLDGDDTGSTLTITGTRIVHLIGLTITGGVAASGGGINRPGDGVLRLRRVTVDYNLAFGQSLASGGGIDSGTGSLKLTASKVIHNRAVAMNSGTTVAMGRATASGGGIAAQGKVTLVGSTIGSNRAAARSADAEAMVFGAGILMGDAPLEVSSSNFKRNSGYAKGKVGGSALGGGVFVNSLSSLSIEKSTFTGNSMTGTSSTGGASAFGAGFDGEFSTGTMSGSRFTDNALSASSSSGSATAQGGAINALPEGPPLSIAGSRILGSTLSASAGTVAYAVGGGISASGPVSLTRSVVAGSTLSAHGPSASAAGGGIREDIESVSVTRSTIEGNHVSATATSSNATASGGGISSEGSTALVSTTVSRNTLKATAHGSGTATSDGGGLYFFGESGQQSAVNSTISNNVAAATSSSTSGTSMAQGGGIWADIVQTSLTNSTLARNGVHAAGHSVKIEGGGVWAEPGEPGTPMLQATILALNTAKLGADCHGKIASAGHNLVRKTKGCTFAAKTNDKVHVDPKLGPLRDNGGPTQTDALLSGSPALDAIPPKACAVTVDQRGVPRPQHRRCDIGAYEQRA